MNDTLRMLKWMVLVAFLAPVGAAYTEEEGAIFIKNTSAESQRLDQISVQALWESDTTLTSEAAQKQTEASENYTKYQELIYPEVIKFPWKTFNDSLLRRQFKILSQPDEAALPVENRTRLSDVINEMTDIYGTTEVKAYQSAGDGSTLTIDDISDFLANSTDTCQMAYYWDGWHSTVGKAVKSRFQEYVELKNLEAVLNNYTDNAAKWQADFEMEDFETDMARLMQKIRPLFKQLHAYIRRRLWIVHGKNSSIIDLKGPIPSTLLGNLWGLDAINVYDRTVPFPDKPSLDVSSQLQDQNYDGVKMARAAEDFYTSINMSAMTDKFWANSIFKRPATGDFDCSPVSYNFFDGEDYRMKMCVSPTLDDFGTMHHEMGHIESYMRWSKLEWLFQDAANPGFNEAIGDMMYMFAVGPTHLKNIGLLDQDVLLDSEQEINALYHRAVETLFFMPYAYTLDLWRWRVFQGKITPDKYNCQYWKIRLQHHGVVPPVDRTEEHFDPGAKYHILANLQYISYFVSSVVQFQLHRSLCITAGQFDPNNPTSRPLYLCDIYRSTEAGNKLMSLISQGKSHVWRDALELVTGQRELDASALLDFLDPLHQWLKEENKKNNETIGWGPKRRRCTKKAKAVQDPCRYTA